MWARWKRWSGATPDPYHGSAADYDRWIEPLNAGLRAIGLRMVPPKSGMIVLDVGCGTGTHLALYQEQGCITHGIDPSPSMLTMAHSKLGARGHLIHGDGSRLPYRNGSFDLVIFSMVLHEAAPSIRTAIFSEGRRVLGRDGRLLIIDYHPGPFLFPKGWWVKGLITAIELSAGSDHFKHYRHFLAGGGITSLADRGGLDVETRKIVSGGNLAVCVLKKVKEP